jgi:hypothetical protein
MLWGMRAVILIFGPFLIIFSYFRVLFSEIYWAFWYAWKEVKIEIESAKPYWRGDW